MSMKIYLKIFLIFFFPIAVCAQSNIDSLKLALDKAPNDAVRFKTLHALYNFYEESNRDSALYCGALMVELAKKNNEKLSEAYGHVISGYQLIGLGKYGDAHRSLLNAFSIIENEKDEGQHGWSLSSIPFSGSNQQYMLSYAHHMFGILMWQADNRQREIFHFQEARRISTAIDHKIRMMMANMNLGRSYLNINKTDSAHLFENEAERLMLASGFKKYLGSVYGIKSAIFLKDGHKDSALQYLFKAIELSEKYNNRNALNGSYFNLANFYLGENQGDSALKYARLNVDVIHELGPISGHTVHIGTVYENFFRAFKLLGPHDSIFKYQSLTLTTKDSISKLRIKNLTEFQTSSFQELLRLQNLEEEKIIYQGKVRTLLLLGGIGILLLLALIFYRNFRQKHKANLKIEQAYENLKATQQQLVQSEKMASLGELTAGIAHEIQNPLNFVNNFSEVNNELIEEVKSNAASLRGGQKSNLKGEELEELLNDIYQNNEKINYHGKRADAIVKGMLQHSRASSGQKEQTDLNALCEEYLRLAYHGLRAKDKTFNAKFDASLDPTIGKIKIIPEDIGRVLLNLINNAFYVVNEKKKSNLEGFEPNVILSTKKKNGIIEIRVKDNGNGIPGKVLDKIFQPFFTTKPTGQGTGLGLSLSYDIVKAHSGELKVETKEGEGTDFIVLLPVN